MRRAGSPCAYSTAGCRDLAVQFADHDCLILSASRSSLALHRGYAHGFFLGPQFEKASAVANLAAAPSARAFFRLRGVRARFQVIAALPALQLSVLINGPSADDPRSAVALIANLQPTPFVLLKRRFLSRSTIA